MKNPIPSRNLRPAAFTLVEMLVVIAIIALLAGIVIPLAGLASKKKKIAQAQAQLKSIEIAIDQYKNKLGFYPPDNTNSAGTNQLFYELLGATANTANSANVVYSNSFNARDTVDGNTLRVVFNVGGIVNSSADPSQVQNFIPQISPSQVKQAQIAGAANPLWVFASPSLDWPTNMIPAVGGGFVNPFRYVSGNPTNNVNSYDLWVNIVIGNTTYRICNWSSEPQVVGP